MSETTVHIAQNSPEYVAYRLFKDIELAEVRGTHPRTDNPVTREYILQTYAQCLKAVKAGWTVDNILNEVPTRG